VESDIAEDGCGTWCWADVFCHCNLPALLAAAAAAAEE